MRDEAADAVQAHSAGPAAWQARAATLPVAAREALAKTDFDAPHAYVTLAATPRDVPAVRAELRRWAQAIGIGAEQAQDVILAVDEAVANAVEHAYARLEGPPGSIAVFAGRELSGSSVHVVVSDTGEWQPPPSEPGFRGRGVSMMTTLADQFDLHHDKAGTTVLLCWNLH